MFVILYTFIGLWLYSYTMLVEGCAATNPGGSITTTAKPPVTTTLVATGCRDCTLDNPSIMHIKKDDGAKDIEIDEVSIGDDGCAIRTITCIGTGPGSTVLLAWNSDAAGITMGDNGANTVTDTLVCNAEGTAWVLFHNFHGPEENRPINQVECVAS